MTSRRWCYTLNNWTQEEYEQLNAHDCVYHICGREVGEEGTPHLQGFIIFKKMMRLSACKKLNGRAHWEAAVAASALAAEYCRKSGDFSELGKVPLAPGDAEKHRWDEAKKRAMAGDLNDIPADIYIKYYRTLKEIAKDNMTRPQDADDVTGVWIYGPPGSGKSRKARADYPDAYLKMQNKWWDGYQGEEYVILDDFDSKELGHLLKIWMDRYAFIGETKGGAIYVRPRKFVITTNYRIDDMGWDDVLAQAIKRRCELIHVP